MLARGQDAVAALVCAAVGCATNGGPTLLLDDQHIAVGVPFSLEIVASNQDGAEIQYSMDTNAPGVDRSSNLSRRPDGSALFTWTPTAGDVGDWSFDFTALDARGSTTETIEISVSSAIGAASFPVFRRPLGAGSSLDVEKADCVEFEVVITDQDSTAVTLAQEEPTVAGATLEQTGDLEGVWSWCPNEEQKVASGRHIVTISADDGANPKAIKHYQIVLRHGLGENCLGGKPKIAHEARELILGEDDVITASISDDDGLNAPPLFYYSLEDPGEPPDLDKMTQLVMAQSGGDVQDGMWEVEIPDLVLDRSSASNALHYVIIAGDNDDKGGVCDHVTAEAYQVSVSSGGGSSPCEPCSKSSECGGPDDLCLIANAAGTGRCFSSCDGGCPEGYECLAQEIESIDGKSGLQCVPSAGLCPQDQSTCVDDVLEPNSSRSSATDLTTREPDEPLEARLCPIAWLADDDDWFQVTTTEEGGINFYVTGELDETEVDLSLYDQSGQILARSENWGASDNVYRCVPPGTYYVRAYSSFPVVSDYKIAYQIEPMSCAQSTCDDDLFEDDDDIIYGRVINRDVGYNASENRICPFDEDYYFIEVRAGETLYVRADFEHNDAYEDIDVILLDGNTMELVTQCTEDDTSGCDPTNGQSGTSNEQLVWTAEELTRYYVIVRGFGGSSNDYDICIGLSPEFCGLSVADD